jgi:2-iminobutanoate/2-iminopropanoate deaminase
MSRTSIEVMGLHHGNTPIPQASKVGPLVASSGINGIDADSGTVPDSIEDQTVLIFANIKKIMAAAGGSTRQVHVLRP